MIFEIYHMPPSLGALQWLGGCPQITKSKYYKANINAKSLKAIIKAATANIHKYESSHRHTHRHKHSQTHTHKHTNTNAYTHIWTKPGKYWSTQKYAIIYWISQLSSVVYRCQKVKGIWHINRRVRLACSTSGYAVSRVTDIHSIKIK